MSHACGGMFRNWPSEECELCGGSERPERVALALERIATALEVSTTGTVTASVPNGGRDGACIHGNGALCPYCEIQRKDAELSALRVEVDNWRNGPIDEAFLRVRDGYLHLGRGVSMVRTEDCESNNDNLSALRAVLEAAVCVVISEEKYEYIGDRHILCGVSVRDLRELDAAIAKAREVGK
jgi:hypothetical protein